MNNKSNAGISVSINRLLTARNCKKHGEYLGLGIINNSDESHFRAEVKKMQGYYMGKPEAPEKVEEFIMQQTKREWYRMDAQYDILVREEAAYQKKLASFFIGRKCVASNIQWTIPYALKVGTAEVSEIYGYVTAVLKDSDSPEQYTAVIIKDGKPEYSKYARNFRSKPEYAPELIGAYLGLCNIYGSSLQVMLVYPRGKEEAPDAAFNEKHQIITADFTMLSNNELQRRIHMVLTSYEKQPDCSTCFYESICSGMRLTTLSTSGDCSGQSSNSGPKFTESQQEVINFKSGACAVYAVPGAGKTTTLVHRLIKLLDTGINPKNILFVTFTNKATEEIRSRVKSLLQTEFEEELPDIFTYNGLGWQILRDNRDIVGDLKLLTPMDEKRLLMECIDSFVEPLKGYSYRYVEGRYGLLPQLLNTFRRLGEDQATEEESLIQKGHLPEQILRLKSRYIERIRAENYIDFDQQIVLAKGLLLEHPDICKEYGKRWQYIMADEYQDSSQDNVDLLYALANAGPRNLVVVGDTDQSIYEWRNGSPKHLLEFADHFPECKRIYMNDNFRSVRQILDASNELISKNANRIDMYMVAHKESNAKPYRVRDCSLERIPELLELLKSRNYEYGDIGILSRTNAPLNKVKALLDKAGIDSISPSDFLIKDPFFILLKDLLDMYYLGFSETDICFYRYLMVCGCNILVKANKDETFYENILKQENLTPIQANCMEAMLAYDIEEDTEQQDNPIYLAFRRLYRIFTQFFSSNEPMAALKIICRAFHLDPDASAVVEILRLSDYQDFYDLKEFWEYLTWMTSLNDDRKIEQPANADKVNLMTAHSSKGKEFPAIIILQTEDFGVTEEERRLLYVAMTRAKKCLFVLESPNKVCDLLSEVTDYLHSLQFS